MGCVGGFRVLEVVYHNPDNPLDPLILVAKPVEEDNNWILSEVNSPFLILAIVVSLNFHLGKRNILKDRLEPEVVEHFMELFFRQLLPGAEVEPQRFVFERCQIRIEPRTSCWKLVNSPSFPSKLRRN